MKFKDGTEMPMIHVFNTEFGPVNILGDSKAREELWKQYHEPKDWVNPLNELVLLARGLDRIGISLVSITIKPTR